MVGGGRTDWSAVAGRAGGPSLNIESASLSLSRPFLLRSSSSWPLGLTAAVTPPPPSPPPSLQTSCFAKDGFALNFYLGLDEQTSPFMATAAAAPFFGSDFKCGMAPAGEEEEGEEKASAYLLFAAIRPQFVRNYPRPSSLSLSLCVSSRSSSPIIDQSADGGRAVQCTPFIYESRRRAPSPRRPLSVRPSPPSFTRRRRMERSLCIKGEDCFSVMKLGN